jgi:superfamily II DNA/RNA helicase
MNYSELAIDESLKRAVAEMGYETLTPIQEKAIPVVLSGRDVMGAAQTGTGKTAAFSLPILHRLLPEASASMSPARHPVRALILAPTRELADQVAANVKAYAKHTLLRSTVVFGGVDMGAQTDELRRGVEVLIATPGRLLDHLEARNTSLAQVKYVVLDEADRMLDIGFLPDLQRILAFLPKDRTTLLFSATFSPEIKKLAASYLRDPVLVEVARPNATATTVEQLVYETREADKRGALKAVLKRHGIEQAIVFVNSKIGAGRLARSLERDGFKASAMHGDKSQAERLATLDAFKAGEVKLLVATDVAARGLDIVELPAVVNYDIPFNAEDYVHRIGRTGRAGASGLAVSLTTPEDSRSLADIEKLIKRKFEVQRIDAVDERPARRERRWRDDDAERAAPRGAAPRPAPVRDDPLFTQPYEPDPATEPARDAQAAANPRTPQSPNIRPKRKVAALLGGKR